MEQLNKKTANSLLKFMTKQLGSEAYGEVALVNWQGTPAALKVATSASCSESIASEADVVVTARRQQRSTTVERQSHRLVGVPDEPPVLSTYKGNQTRGNLYENPLYIDNLIDIGLQVGQKLLEIHEAGIVHNDT